MEVKAGKMMEFKSERERRGKNPTYRNPSAENAPCSVVKSVTLLTLIVCPNCPPISKNGWKTAGFSFSTGDTYFILF